MTKKPTKPKPPPSRDIPNTTDGIIAYLHCARCVVDFKQHAQATFGESPATYARLNVGWTALGLQVVCVRHDCNVLHIDFEGQPHPANTSRPLEEEEKEKEGAMPEQMTPEEEAGVAAIIALQALVGIADTPEAALFGWRALTDAERATTLRLHDALKKKEER
jgi:hypothetical protein